MAAQPRLRDMKHTDGRRIDRDSFDIIECALRNDFKGVNIALQSDRQVINAQKSNTGITALMGASGRGLFDMVQHLLSKDFVDVRIVDDFGNSAFDHARLFLEIVTILIQHSHPTLQWKEPGILPVQ